MSQIYPIERVIDGTEALEVMTATLIKYSVGHLGLFDGSFPYVVPVNHTYVDGRLIMHCSLTGKKVDIIKRNPSACYSVCAPVDGMVAFRESENDARLCSRNYESVVCYGYVKLIEDLQDRREYLNLIARDYRRAELKDAEEETCNCIVLDILEMTGRYAFRPAPKVIYSYAFKESGLNSPYLKA
jgi:nitroimidazol reductase NimA-like FMN-containing flavoprotein (pyridoxamine 5'-phosphate oxidase superfamily)